ncbi:MAG: YgeY family selenium metabolism-linked hydrolase [Candidatus Accumulibacter sp.]|jgi:putative selenium metabolism hydrolase|nr:YgeY family selenium metabolism-linked hydrolase [Accumulibacter sp.]
MPKPIPPALSPEIQNAVIKLCRDLIAEPSYSGHEDRAAAVLRRFMETQGYDEIFMDDYGSLVGCIHGLRPGPTLVFDGHLDTVPAEAAAWRHPPFEARIEDGRIYGRGASDMKGAIAAMAVGAAAYANAARRDFPGTLCVAGTVHEECFEGIAARKISERLRPDFVVIGEASELDLKIGQRGRAEIVLETFGVEAHSANPGKGVNAVLAMLRLAQAIDAIAPPQHPVLGPGQAVLTDIVSSPYPGASVVPSRCRATYDRRLHVGETPESVLAPFDTALQACAAADPTFKGRAALARGRDTCHTGAVIEAERFFPGWLFPESAPFVQRALAALREAGLDPKISRYSFCTNGSHYAGEKGIPTLGFGPSCESQAHTVDEYIELEELYQAVAGYTALCSLVSDR